MSNDAFILAEAEMLHALGVLLVSAYESSVEKAKTTQLLGAEDELRHHPQTTVFIECRLDSNSHDVQNTREIRQPSTRL